MGTWVSQFNAYLSKEQPGIAAIEWEIEVRFSDIQFKEIPTPLDQLW